MGPTPVNPVDPRFPVGPWYPCVPAIVDPVGPVDPVVPRVADDIFKLAPTTYALFEPLYTTVPRPLTMLEIDTILVPALLNGLFVAIPCKLVKLKLLTVKEEMNPVWLRDGGLNPCTRTMTLLPNCGVVYVFVGLIKY
jgi:hypothetical protein